MFIPLDITRDWPWVRQYLPVAICSDTRGIISVSDRGEYDAVCVLNSWAPNSVQAHICILNPFVIRKGFLSEVANYVFNTCGVEVMLGPVPADNEKALKFDKHIGFTEVCRIKNGYSDGVDYVLLEMRRENCRWLERLERAA